MAELHYLQNCAGIESYIFFCVAISRHFSIRNQRRQVVNLFLMRCHDKMENIDYLIIFLKTISMQATFVSKQIILSIRMSLAIKAS